MGSSLVWTQALLESNIRLTIGDPSGANTTRWGQDELEDYANRGAHQIVLDTEYPLETSWTTTLAADQKEYELPENFVRTRIVEYVFSSTDIRRLTYLTIDEYNSSHSRNPTTTGDPNFYHIWRRLGDDPTTNSPTSIYLTPTPGATQASKTLRVYGYKYPDAFDFSANGTLVVEFPGPYCEAICLYVRFLTKLDDDDDVGAARAYQLYQSQVQKILDFQSRKDKSEPNRLQPRSSIFTGVYNHHRRYPILPWQRGY